MIDEGERDMIVRRNSYFLYSIITIFLYSYSLTLVSYEKKQLNVLMVVPVFPKIHDICMLNQMTGLIDRGHSVSIYAPKLGDILHMQEDVIKYNLLSHLITGELPDNLDCYDIVVFQLGHKATNIKKTHNYKGKVVVCLRGYDITGFIKSNPHAYDDLFESVDLFMPVCEAFKKKLQDLGCSSDKIVVHHSGINCSRFAFKARQFPVIGPINIVSVGRFVEKKGFMYSIRAIAQLVKRYPRIHYTIIGDGILKKKYKKYIKQFGIRSRVTIDGWYSHDEYVKVLDKAHIFIVPSVTAHDNDQEGIPNVLKEAMAMGLMVVATDHSGNYELIEDKISGFLVPERNSGAIVRAVDYVLSKPEEWASLQFIARSLVCKKFDTEKLNDDLEKIFIRLINGSTNG